MDMKINGTLTQYDGKPYACPTGTITTKTIVDKYCGTVREYKYIQWGNDGIGHGKRFNNTTQPYDKMQIKRLLMSGAFVEVHK